MSGTSNNDHIIGGINNDTIIGSAGADTIEGSDGLDWVNYHQSSDTININLSTGSASGGNAADDTLSSIENIIATKGNDTLVGNNENNILIGGEGNDQLTGGIGYDILDGGSGQDNYIVKLGKLGDIVIIKGFDTRSGEAIDLTALNEHITGFKDLSISYNTEGSAIIECPTGQYIVIEHIGDGAIGAGHFKGNASIYSGGSGNDILHGGHQGDYIDGSAGNDKLHGHRGDDTIDGGSGFDTIIDGAGNDIMTGGENADSFMIKAAESTTTDEPIAEHDIITDFDTNDANEKIYITGYGNNDTVQAIIDRAVQTDAGVQLELLDGKTVLLENVTKSELNMDQIIVGDGAVMKASRNKMLAKLNHQLQQQDAMKQRAIDAQQALKEAEENRIAAQQEAERLTIEAEAAEAASAAAIQAEADAAKVAQEQAEAAEEQAQAQADEIQRLEAEAILKAREAKIGLEFNIGNGKTIGEVDVKQISIEDSDEDQFIVAWNEINGDTFDTHVQVFNQYGETVSEDTIIETRTMEDNHNDVAVIDNGKGEYKVGNVGKKITLHSHQIGH